MRWGRKATDLQTEDRRVATGVTPAARFFIDPRRGVAPHMSKVKKTVQICYTISMIVLAFVAAGGMVSLAVGAPTPFG